MSDTTHRIEPLTGHELNRRSDQEHITGADAIQPAEIHSSRDALGLRRFFVGHKFIGPPFHHGSVADEAAMLVLDNPFAAHACFPGDTCRRLDTGALMLCVSGYGTAAADWISCAGGEDTTALYSAISEKADASALDALAGVVSGKADSSSLDALAGVVSGKADSSSLDALASVVSGKQDALPNIAVLDDFSEDEDGTLLWRGAPVGGAAVVLLLGVSVLLSSVVGTLVDGDIPEVDTGWGWCGNGYAVPVSYLSSFDDFSGIPNGDLTEWTTGTGWTGAGYAVT